MWDLSPPLVVEETERSKHGEQHEPHRGDSEKDAQSPSILFLWGWKGGDGQIRVETAPLETPEKGDGPV